MSEIFGTKYFGFIASSYAVTAVVLLIMVGWVLMTYSKRKRDFAQLEKAGLIRASKN